MPTNIPELAQPATRALTLISILFTILRGPRSRYLSGVLVGAVITFMADAALADCAPASFGTVCQPLVSGINTPAAGTLAIGWVPGGGVPPQSVKLISGGSAAKGFLDGQTLASASETSALGNYASYLLTASNLGSGNTLSVLHVVGIWGSSSLPSAQFAATTLAAGQSSGESSYTTPSITAATFNGSTVSISWNSGGKTYDFYNVRWSSAASC